jgi:hypothetical protein
MLIDLQFINTTTLLLSSILSILKFSMIVLRAASSCEALIKAAEQAFSS